MILALNTATPQFGIALMAANGTVHAGILLPRQKGHFGTLMPAFDFILRESVLTTADISMVAVASGPGSFTGLRVGLSLAKGVCHALGLPLVGISTMAAMASGVSPANLPLAPVLYARKNEVFTALFTRDKGGELLRKRKDICLKFTDLHEVFRSPTLFVGDDFEGQRPLIKEVLGDRAVFAPPQNWKLDPVQIGLLALKRLNDGDLDDPATLTPVYMRPPDLRPNPFPLLTKSMAAPSGPHGNPVDNSLQKR